MLLDLLPPKLRPYAKAVVAALVPVLTAVALGLATGTWDKAQLVLLGVAAFSALFVARTTNER